MVINFASSAHQNALHYLKVHRGCASKAMSMTWFALWSITSGYLTSHDSSAITRIILLYNRSMFEQFAQVYYAIVGG